MKKKINLDSIENRLDVAIRALENNREARNILLSGDDLTEKEALALNDKSELYWIEYLKRLQKEVDQSKKKFLGIF